MAPLALPIPPTEFLRDYWQRKPLFIPGGLAPFDPPLSADELGVVALDPEADARIVFEGPDGWALKRGPLREADLQQPGRWSLLVQGLEHYSDEAAALLDTLPFLPRWRLDDVLMSYATDGAGAGPHFDLYDVFIVQGAGAREWRLGQLCDANTPLLQIEELKLLADFQETQRLRMCCGDVLYIPPGVAHWGQSLGESTSFSIGLRAPRLKDLLARWIDNKLELLDDDLLLRDAGREVAVHRGEIGHGDIARARDQLTALLDFADNDWLGEVLSETPFDRGGPETGPAIPEGRLRLAPGARLPWMREGDGLKVFAAGESRGCETSVRDLLEALNAGEAIAPGVAPARENSYPLLQWLLATGTLEPDE